MASNNSPRARLRRSGRTEGTEAHQDALSHISENLGEIIDTLTEKAKAGDTQAAKALIDLSKDEFVRSRSGANDPLLVKIREIREAGSERQRQIWETLYRNVPLQMEIAAPK